MNYTKPITYNNNPITSNRKVRKLGHNILMSLGVPITFTLIAIILAYSNGNTLLLSTGGSSLKNIMSLCRTIFLTIVAACALNANLNSGRMDFALGATGVLSTIIAYRLLPNGLDSIGTIFLFILYAMIFGAIIGIIHSIIFILLKVPPIVTSLGMCLILEGLCRVINGGTEKIQIIGDKALYANFFFEPIIILPLIALAILLMSLLICYSKFGYEKNALVFDQRVSVETGIKEVASCVICYIVAGILIGIYTSVDCIGGTGTIDIPTDLGSSQVVFRNFLPIFIGGIIAKYSNQIVGLSLAVFSTSILSLGMDKALGTTFDSTMKDLINGFMVFGVLVYMVDKQRFVNWVKMRKYLAKEKYLNPKLKVEDEGDAQ